MREEKDWSYFEFEVGRYSKDHWVSDENFTPYKPQTKKLVWYVFTEENGEIIPINLFEYNWVFLEYLLQAKKKYKDDFVKFADDVRLSLQHEYWSRCEYETIITSWPAYIDEEELDRLNKERDDRKAKGQKFYRESVSPTVGYKIDVYMQVMLNWDKFIDYVWKNKRLITRKKLGLD